MLAKLLELLTTKTSKSVGIGIICLVAGVAVFYYSNQYFVSRSAHSQEVKAIKVNCSTNKKELKKEIKVGDASQQINTLYLQKGMAEKQVWDIDARIEDLEKNGAGPEQKAKWKRRLERTEEEVKEIDGKIETEKKKLTE